MWRWFGQSKWLGVPCKCLRKQIPCQRRLQRVERNRWKIPRKVSKTPHSTIHQWIIHFSIHRFWKNSCQCNRICKGSVWEERCSKCMVPDANNTRSSAKSITTYKSTNYIHTVSVLRHYYFDSSTRLAQSGSRKLMIILMQYKRKLYLNNQMSFCQWFNQFLTD